MCDEGYRKHEDFEESTEEVKPLTEEEKAAHLDLLKQRYAAILISDLPTKEINAIFLLQAEGETSTAGYRRCKITAGKRTHTPQARCRR